MRARPATAHDVGTATRHGRVADDAGLASIWVVTILPIIVLFGVLSFTLWDGYTERRILAEQAEAAARSGANAVDIDEFYSSGRLVIDPALARRLALETLDAQVDLSSLEGAAVDVEDGRVVVRLRGSVDVLLFGSLDIAVEAAAQPDLVGG